jgi:hypothetical protein
MSMHRALFSLAVLVVVWLLPMTVHAADPLVVDDDGEGVVEGAPHSSPSTSPAEARPRPPAERSIVRGLAGGGASTAALFGLRSNAVHLDGGLGVESKRLYIPIFLSAELGQTPGGLGAGEVTLGIGFLGIATERLRVGGGVDAGYGWITRASTSTLPHIGMFGLDAFALATFDLFSIGDRRAVYIGVKPSVGVRWGESFFAWDHGTVAWRGAAMVGMRF